MASVETEGRLTLETDCQVPTVSAKWNRSRLSATEDCHRDYNCLFAQLHLRLSLGVSQPVDNGSRNDQRKANTN